MKKIKAVPFRTGVRTWLRTAINAAAALCCIGAYMLLIAKTDYDPVVTGCVVALVYVFISVLLFVLFTLRTSPAEEGEEVSQKLSAITLDLMVKLYMPMIISDEDGRIIWHNSAFDAQLGGGGSVYGKNISDISTLPLSELLADTTPEGKTVTVGGGIFRIKAYKIHSKSKNYCITVWKNTSELHEAYKLLSEEATIVAYIVIDNLDEMQQYMQEKYREASSEVEVILKEWAASVNGILKEYERDQYLFIFNAHHLALFEERKFDVLDRIRNVRVGDGNLPVTVSVGIAHTGANLAEKAKAASSALDMALQRGGDQVVVKKAGGMEFYGGKTKTVQKRTKVRSRVVANELAMYMAKSPNVLIMGHKNADFDSVGACAGIARLAAFCGVRFNIIVNQNDTAIKKPLAKLRGLTEYRDIFVSADEAQDLIMADTLLIIVDVNNVAQYEAQDIAANVQNHIIIDHHRKAAEYKLKPVVSYIEPSASSTSELVAEILEQALPGGVLLKEEADTLFAGILLDTKQFARNTGVRTFGAALYLRNEGANPADAQQLFKINIDDFKSEAKYESNVVIYRGNIAIAANEDAGGDAERVAAAKAADKLLTVEGVSASFALCRIGDAIHISARSQGSINVQVILERLGGGGHFDSAATALYDVTMTEAYEKLKAAIDES